mmetsp:Transcript_15024/g.38402  ORF Transcript_15024/g.38402 Transcript_15024/m.38402 type:complete len:81 (+) Transcript_15024:61-303(+)
MGTKFDSSASAVRRKESSRNMMQQSFASVGDCKEQKVESRRAGKKSSLEDMWQKTATCPTLSCAPDGLRQIEARIRQRAE